MWVWVGVKVELHQILPAHSESREEWWQWKGRRGERATLPALSFPAHPLHARWRWPSSPPTQIHGRGGVLHFAKRVVGSLCLHVRGRVKRPHGPPTCCTREDGGGWVAHRPPSLRPPRPPRTRRSRAISVGWGCVLRPPPGAGRG